MSVDRPSADPAPNAHDLAAMQDLARTLMRTQPHLVNRTVGELAWAWAKDVDLLRDAWRFRGWRIDGRLVGWGWVSLPYQVRFDDGSPLASDTADLLFQIDPAYPEVLDDVLAWCDRVAPPCDRTVCVQSGDEDAAIRVRRAGYLPDPDAAGPDGRWTELGIRPLDAVPTPVLPAGFRIVSADRLPPSAAVAAHRSAWHPARFTEQALAQVRATPPYRGDLHLLLVAPDDTPVTSTIIWFDAATLTAEFEPVGTHRSYRRQGLARALQLAGMHRAKAAGANHMLVAYRGADADEAARRLYHSVGFRPVGRDVPFIKRGPR